MDPGSSQAVIAPAGVLATLLPPPAEGSESGGWGFEIALLPEEGVDVFAIARAQVMWRALRNTGLYRHMQQFRANHPSGSLAQHQCQCDAGSESRRCDSIERREGVDR